MDSYKDLNKKEILSRWYEFVDLLEREWTMTPDGDIIKIPNDEIAKAYCKVLLKIYKQIEPFADEIKRDYEGIKDKNLHDIQANDDWDFLRVGAGVPDNYRELKSLIDAFHLEDSETLAVKETAANPIQKLMKENPKLWKDGIWLFGAERKLIDYLNGFKGGTTPRKAAERYLDLSNVNSLEESGTKIILYNLLSEAGIIKCTDNNFYKQLGKSY